jgi:hypothetical protein
MTDTSLNNIHMIERVLRLFFGCSLIGSVFFMPIPFDYLILLPLIGIYPCLTAIVGWDPLYYVLDIEQKDIERLIDERLEEKFGRSALLMPRAV